MQHASVKGEDCKNVYKLWVPSQLQPEQLSSRMVPNCGGPAAQAVCESRSCTCHCNSALMHKLAPSLHTPP